MSVDTRQGERNRALENSITGGYLQREKQGEEQGERKKKKSDR